MGDNLIGRVLDRQYKIQGSAGEGKVACVFTAHDNSSLDRQVAVKVVKAEYTSPPGVVEALTRKVPGIINLNHPNILRIYDFRTTTVDDAQRFYLVMQLAQGGTLADRLEAGTISLDETERILKRVCAALDYAHSQQVLHLDLKPTNILFGEQGHVMVADLGLAKLVQEATHGKAVTDATTEGYMSPEQASEGQVGPFSDVYAVGILLYQMLTGRLPERKHGQDLAIQVPRSLPSALQPVLERATRADPQQRYHTAGELAEAFTAAIHPPPVHIVALRQVLRKLGQLCESQTTFDQAQAELMFALGYGKPGKDKFLERQQDSIVVRTAGERPLAVIAFMPPGCAPADRLAQLKQQYTADRLPDTGVLCNGQELWLYQRTERDFYPYPTLRVSLKDASHADAQTLHEWLGRRTMELFAQASRPAGAAAGRRHVRAWQVVGGLMALATLVGTSLFGVERWRAGGRTTGTPSSTPQAPVSLLTPPPSPTAKPSPSATPTATPAPTPTSMYLTVIDAQAQVYTGPGEIYDGLGKVDEGARLPILGCSEDGRWLQVHYLGWSGWIARQCVALSPTPFPCPMVEAPPTPFNPPPIIHDVIPAATAIKALDMVTVICNASGPDDSALTYIWEASDGSITGEGNSIVYQAPIVASFTTITVTVRDERGREAQRSIQVQVTSIVPPEGLREPVGIFGQMWYEHPQVHQRLGWAARGEEGMTGAAQQFFERGVMLWREDLGQIYVLTQDRKWHMYVDTWEEQKDEYSCSNVAPRQTPPTPMRGFGKVWCEQLGGSNAEIGWATTGEQAYSAHWQHFERGLMWQGFDGQIYVLYYEDDSWEPFHE